jgi:class 3 adenylate cyclase
MFRILFVSRPLFLGDSGAARRAVTERRSGVTFSGDGFVASFDGPARAIRCAQGIIEATGKLGVQLRAGLHTGECEVRGDNLGGLAVHIAARVGALASPGEVLLSGVSRTSLSGRGSTSAIVESINSRCARVLEAVRC